MAAIATLTANLELNDAKFSKRLRDVNKSLDQTRRNSRNVNRSIRDKGSALRASTIAWSALGASVAGAAAVTAKAVRVFSDIESSQLRTQALLRSTGSAAGRTFEQLEEQARGVARTTLASTQDIRQAQAILLTFRSIQEENFDRTIELSQDLAAVLGTQAKDAALQLGKALEDPTTGLTALRRSGVSFSQAQKDVIAQMQRTGDLAGAQGLILDTLAAQVAGAGAGAAGGLAGATDSLSQSWEEFLEALAQSGPARLAASGLSQLAGAINQVNGALTETDEQAVSRLNRQIDSLNERLSNSPQRRVAARLRAQLRDARRELDEVEGRIAEEQAAQDRARAAADDARRRADRERQDALRLEAETAGAKRLETLQSQLADELQTIELQHAQRVEAIRGLTLSEERIRAAGFDNLAELQAAFEARSLQIYQESIAERRQAELDAEAAEQKRIDDEGARQKKENDNLVDLQRERFNRIHQEALAAPGSQRRARALTLRARKGRARGLYAPPARA